MRLEWEGGRERHKGEWYEYEDLDSVGNLSHLLLCPKDTAFIVLVI